MKHSRCEVMRLMVIVLISLLALLPTNISLESTHIMIQQQQQYDSKSSSTIPVNPLANHQFNIVGDNSIENMGAQLQQQAHQLAYEQYSSPTLKWINLQQQHHPDDDEDDWDDRDSCIDLDYERQRFKFVHHPSNAILKQNEYTIWDIDEIARLTAIQKSISLPAKDESM
jgi:hypothetical protein